MATGGNALLDTTTGFVLATQLPTSLSSDAQILSSTTGINGTVAATTALYTVPAGKQAVVLAIIFRVTASSTVISVGSASVGQNAGVNDIMPITALTSLTAANTALPVFMNVPIQVVQTGNIISLKITTAYVATTLTLAVELIGYLI